MRLCVLVLALSLGCVRPSVPAPAGDPAVTRSGLSAGTPLPSGSIPAALPAELVVGLGDTQVGATWMRDARDAGARFSVRYRYLVTDASGGWTTNWNSAGVRDGRFARRYMDESAAIGVMPAFSFYELLGVASGGEGTYATKVQNVAAMKRYYEDFRLLMQVAKAFGRPVLIHIEPDGQAQLQIQTGGDANRPAAVDSTGVPEVSGLPNTVAGWGRSFAQIRDRVGATNVILGHHYSVWATNVDLMRSPIADIGTHVGRTVTFLNALGLQQQDVVFVEMLDRDCAFRNMCWDTRDNAGVNTQSYVRHMAIFEAVNRISGKRLVNWQIPLGGPYQLNVTNTGQKNGGWKSGHTTYFFGPEGAAHRERFGSAGGIALLFGQGATGQSSQFTDQGADGGLFTRGAVAEFFRGTSTAVQLPPVCVDAGTLTTTTPGGLQLPR